MECRRFSLEVSANGVDYDGAGFLFMFQDPAYVYRIAA